jgi:oligopeptide/dipeptide ABC transporter ATP-binding protein
VETILAEALLFHRIAERAALDRTIDELLALVGLAADARKKYPHELSGGQRQRIGIARALSVKPDFLLLDEPVSALDVSIRAQILNLLTDLKEQLGLTYLFISHDLGVVEHFADRVMVMYLGRIVESLPAKDLRASARHPYTTALLEAVPSLVRKERRFRLEGDVPSPLALPPGCAFADRCPKVEQACREMVPDLVSIGSHHRLACPVVARAV